MIPKDQLKVGDKVIWCNCVRTIVKIKDKTVELEVVGKKCTSSAVYKNLFPVKNQNK